MVEIWKDTYTIHTHVIRGRRTMAEGSDTEPETGAGAWTDQVQGPGMGPDAGQHPGTGS